MASGRPQRNTQEINYRLWNGGLEDDVPDEDRRSDFIPDPPSSLVEYGLIEPILPSESVSQTAYPAPSLLLDPVLPLIYHSSSNTPSVVSTPACPLKRRHERINHWIWNHFNQETLNETWKTRHKVSHYDILITCRRCTEYTTKDSIRSGSVSNMKLHLANKHQIFAPDTTPEDEQQCFKQQKSILESFTAKSKLSVPDQFQQDIIDWILKSKLPFRVIELPQFKRIFENLPHLNLSSALMSRTTLKRRLEERFIHQRAQLKDELASTCQTIALSLDIWTSKNNIPVLGIIGHWITAKFAYRERVLEFTELKGAHSGENIAHAVYNVLEELHIREKLLTITADNATNNEAMVSELHARLCHINPQFDGLNSFIRCFAHVVNLIVRDILKQLKSSDTSSAHMMCDGLNSGLDIGAETPLSRLRILAIWISRSPQRQQQWKEICNIRGLPDRRIHPDVETRWNSTFRMLESAIESKDQIMLYLRNQLELPSFSEYDWRRLDQLHLVLKQFEVLTRFVSRDRPQLSMAIPLYYRLHDLLYQTETVRGVFTHIDKDIQAAVYHAFGKYDKYYKLMEHVDAYYTSLVLDPRVKGDVFKSHLVDSDQQAGKDIITHIRTSLYAKYAANQLNLTGQSSDEVDVLSNCAPDDLVSQMFQHMGPIPIGPAGSDIDEYFNVSRVPYKKGHDDKWIFNWWLTHYNEMPHIASAARDHLAIPIAEVAVERLFSRARDLLGIRRYSMSSETMRILMLMEDIEKVEDEDNI